MLVVVRVELLTATPMEAGLRAEVLRAKLYMPEVGALSLYST